MLCLLIRLTDLVINLDFLAYNLFNNGDFCASIAVRLIHPRHGCDRLLAHDLVHGRHIERIKTKRKPMRSIMAVVLIRANRQQFALVSLKAKEADQGLEG